MFGWFRRRGSNVDDPYATAYGPTPTYSYRDAGCSRRADPVNVLAPFHPPSYLSGKLLGEAVPGTDDVWKEARYLASDQWIPVTGGSSRVQADQLVAGPVWNRFHVRVWDNGDDPVRTVAGAHHELLFSLGVALKVGRGLHWSSFNPGREAVKATLLLANAAIPDGSMDLQNASVEGDADGMAIVVSDRDW